MAVIAFVDAAGVVGSAVESDCEPGADVHPEAKSAAAIKQINDRRSNTGRHFIESTYYVGPPPDCRSPSASRTALQSRR